MDDGLLLRHSVKTDNMPAFEALADAIDATAAMAITLRPDSASGRSALRVAVEKQPPNHAVAERLLSMYAAGVAQPSGYAYAVHFEAAPTLKDDLIFILKHATGCTELVVGLLETTETVMAPASRYPGPGFACLILG